MKRLKSNFNYGIICAVFLAVFVLYLVGCAFAQGDAEFRIFLPKFGGLALISTGGVFGYLIRFARRRFQEFKRCFDIVVAAVALVVSAPIVIFTAMLIKVVSPGAAFFRQERVGLEGTTFNIYKLRTMIIDAEKDSGPMWARENDPRLIKFGRIIRKMHIDEIPQLINVLKGEMTIVGPRPERPVFVEKLDKQIIDYRKRLSVKPGITGLAQVWHKYDETLEDVKKKIKLDLLYIRKMCLMVDMRILALTVVTVLTGRGAR